MAKLPFMMGRYKWLVKVLSVGAECKGEDPKAEQKKTISTKQHSTTADNGPLANSGDKKGQTKNIEKPHFYYNKVFNDPIHGHILLDPILVTIINTPEFQRLRNIKQLGGVYFVYPGASHNRFEHSIGVAHLAGELAKALKMKQEEQIKPLQELKKLKKLMDVKSELLEELEQLEMLTTEELKDLGKMKKLQNMKPEELEMLTPEELEKDKLTPEDLEKCKKLKNFEPKELKNLEESLITEKDILCVQIAGLCHDLGHGPFSHLFDRMFMPEAIERGKDDETGKEGKTWEHEDASIKMFRHLLDKSEDLKDKMKKRGLEIEKKEKDWKFIKELIKGHKKDKDGHKLPFEGRDKNKSFLYEIVSNKETGIDVDKFDYFARDCHHLGIRNNFDHKRFIMFARVCDVKEKDKKEKIKHICSRDKEVANLYDIFQQRHSIHRRACKHKIALAVEIMIKDALVLADLAAHTDPHFQIKGSNDMMFCLCKAKDDMEAYIKLTDHVIERILNFSPSSNEGKKDDFTESTSKEGRKDDSPLKKARVILHRVMNRDLYYCVGQAMKKDQVEKSKGFFAPVRWVFSILLFPFRYFDEQYQDMKEKLRKELREAFSDDGEDDFEVINVTLDYGMENEDPISKAYFYYKDNPGEGFPISKSKVSKFLPEHFSEEKLMVYWKNHKGLKEEQKKEKEQKIRKWFNKWCNNNGFEDVEGDAAG